MTTKQMIVAAMCLGMSLAGSTAFANGYPVQYTKEFLRAEAQRAADRARLQAAANHATQLYLSAKHAGASDRAAYVSHFKAGNPLYRNLTDAEVERITIQGNATYDSIMAERRASR